MTHIDRDTEIKERVECYRYTAIEVAMEGDRPDLAAQVLHRDIEDYIASIRNSSSYLQPSERGASIHSVLHTTLQGRGYKVLPKIVAFLSARDRQYLKFHLLQVMRKIESGQQNAFRMLEDAQLRRDRFSIDLWWQKTLQNEKDFLDVVHAFRGM